MAGATKPFLARLSLFFFHGSLLLHTSHGDFGTAAHYSPPYIPTACYGSEVSQLSWNNLFAAAGDGVWDNGASCGRLYLVSCISAAAPNTCVRGKTILIRIVDYARSSVSRPSTNGTTIVLSEKAFGSIVRFTVESINIEFLQE